LYLATRPLTLQELDGLRQQAQIWCDSRQGEDDKLKAEVELLSGQLLQRSNDLSSLREQLTEARSERDMALQERQQVGQHESGAEGVWFAWMQQSMCTAVYRSCRLCYCCTLTDLGTHAEMLDIHSLHCVL
jgi:hypothetical protein